jgi:hypothetical protein
MAQHKDTKGTVFIIVSVILISAVAGIIFLSIYQQNADSQRAAREYTCGLQYAQFSTEWENCMNR